MGVKEEPQGPSRTRRIIDTPVMAEQLCKMLLVLLLVGHLQLQVCASKRYLVELENGAQKNVAGKDELTLEEERSESAPSPPGQDYGLRYERGKEDFEFSTKDEDAAKEVKTTKTKTKEVKDTKTETKEKDEFEGIEESEESMKDFIMSNFDD